MRSARAHSLFAAANELLAQGSFEEGRAAADQAIAIRARYLGRDHVEVDRLTQSLELDIRKTRRLLDWTPPLGAAEGIASMARAYAAGAT